MYVDVCVHGRASCTSTWAVTRTRWVHFAGAKRTGGGRLSRGEAISYAMEDGCWSTPGNYRLCDSGWVGVGAAWLAVKGGVGGSWCTVAEIVEERET